MLTDRYSQLMDVLSTLDEQGQMPIAMSLIDAIEPSELVSLSSLNCAWSLWISRRTCFA